VICREEKERARPETPSVWYREEREQKKTKKPQNAAVGRPMLEGWLDEDAKTAVEIARAEIEKKGPLLSSFEAGNTVSAELCNFSVE
jgi:hypothetical protein